MSNPELNYWRGKTGGLAGHRPEEDEELAEARLRVQELVFVDAVKKALKKAPPLTDELRQKIIAMLS
jgi:hypothetical protein